VATAFARTCPSEVDTVLRLASAFAAGPVVVGAGADPSGADGLGCAAEAVAGTVARVPGPVADVEPRDGEFGAVVVELDAVAGSLEATVTGPALPGVADADPPAVEPAGSGRRSGCAETAGSAASARIPHTLRIAIDARISISFLMS
jgi:hypothetical protein